MTEQKKKLPVVPEKALEALRAGIQSVLDSQDWSGFLQSIRKIHDYSFNNRLMIVMEQAKRGWDISPFVAGKTKWNQKFNRQIKEGEYTNPIWILAPVMINKKDENGNDIIGANGKPIQIPIRFRGVRVFDHRQTHGDPLPHVDTSGIMDQLQGDVEAPVFEGLCKVASARCVEVLSHTPAEAMGSALGRCWFTAAGGRASKIEIKDGLNLPTMVSIMAHELGHAILHNRDEYLEHDSTSIKELEAESVAYLVCSHYNLDLSQRSFKYIVTHNIASDDVVSDLLRSGDRIFRAYEEIVKTVDDYLVLNKEAGRVPVAA
jgi:hypothetical protein